MKANWICSILIVTAVLLPTSLAKASGDIPDELKTPNYRITKLEGVGYDKKFARQDPSNVIKVDDSYYVYTSKFTGNTPYTGVIGYATSTDGIHFKRAAKLKYVHAGCGPYNPDAFTNTKKGRGITWGVAQSREKGKMCIVRFDVDLDVPQNVQPTTKCGSYPSL